MLLESFDNLEVPWLYHNGALYTAGRGEDLLVGFSSTPMRKIEHLRKREAEASAKKVLEKNHFYSLGSSLEEVVTRKYHEATYPYEAIAMNLARGGCVLQGVLKNNTLGFKRQLYECTPGSDAYFHGSSFSLVHRGSAKELHRAYATALGNQTYVPQSSLQLDGSCARVTIEPFTLRHKNEDRLIDGGSFEIEYDKSSKMIEFPKFRGSTNNPFVHSNGKICLSEAAEWERRGVVPEKRIDNFSYGLSWALIETARMLRTGYSPKVAVVNSLREFPQGRQGGIFVN